MLLGALIATFLSTLSITLIATLIATLSARGTTGMRKIFGHVYLYAI